jgi:hypothetical protein
MSLNALRLQNPSLETMVSPQVYARCSGQRKLFENYTGRIPLTRPILRMHIEPTASLRLIFHCCYEVFGAVCMLLQAIP